MIATHITLDHALADEQRRQARASRRRSSVREIGKDFEDLVAHREIEVVQRGLRRGGNAVGVQYVLDVIWEGH
jgi:hypothetical protein